MISRRALVSRLPLIAVAGFGLFLVKDRLPWPPAALSFARGTATGWIPLASQGDLIEIDGHLAGVPVRIVVDSGAQYSAVDRGLAERLKLPQTAIPLVAYGVSGKSEFTYMARLDLALSGLEIHGLRAAALRLDRLRAATGRSFSLLLGRDVLKRLVLEADLPRRRIRFRRPTDAPPPPHAIVAPLTLGRGGAPELTVLVEGAPVTATIDTGATGVLALSVASARRAGLLAPGRESIDAQSVSLGGVGFDRIVRVATLQSAGVTVRDAPVQIYAQEAVGPAPSGLLGVGFLKRFHVTLDLPARRLVLAPPSLMLVPRP